MRESVIETHLVKQVLKAGGLFRKLKWIGRRGAPDRFIALNRKVFLVEVKRPGETLEPHQKREHARLKAQGVNVVTVSTFEEVDNFIKENS